jgi:hypothetical protein
MSCQLRKMKMMAAASCEQRAPQTQCAKEVQGNFQKMLAEREKQDKMWEQPLTKSTPTENTSKISTNQNG